MASNTKPGILGHLQSPLVIDDGTSCRVLSPTPGTVGHIGSGAITSSLTGRLLEAARRAGPKLPADMRADFLALFSPTAIAVTAGTLTAWAALHFVGIGELADAILVAVGVFTIGTQAFTAAKDIARFIQIARTATTDQELDEAAAALARAISIIGVTAFIALIFRGAKGSGKGAKATGKFWEAYDFEPDYAGTRVSTSFKLAVDGKEFWIKPNGTKHMGEYSSGQSQGPGTMSSQTDFPISSIAAALEQVSKRGLLKQIIQDRGGVVGTRADPLRIDEWEFSIEYVSGKFEVFHAVYRP